MPKKRSESNDDTDYESWFADDLKAELKKRGVSTLGKKSELIERLRNLDEEEASLPKKKQKSGKDEDDSESSSTDPDTSNFLIKHLTDPDWLAVLKPEFEKPYFLQILSTLNEAKKKSKQIFPPENEIFAAFNLTPLKKVKVVILGQDPYHDDNQAHGLCFSVKKGIKPPPSLKNIYKELSTDISDFEIPSHGYLAKWAQEGILMLNTAFTVEAHKANSHSKIGWMDFSDAVIKIVNEKLSGVVFVLWGGQAQKKKKLISDKNYVVEAAHPSPMGGGKFFGSKCFSKINGLLEKQGKTPIDWKLPSDV